MGEINHGTCRRVGKVSRPMRRAFTLIELLIVVAIIGILAAIAVPNFINAQERAKVGRARSDVRSIVNALEMYRLDNNNYPLF
ncbi:MAG TPA: prepilin-type N-terminal cleavage/methylation domain-containing protein, partial [bacterium]|nr:prepilin-type N-terminal cleavage/methylation domain-containing protein [bacterium]